jgi:methionyl-tRNA formyltransferase
MVRAVFMGSDAFSLPVLEALLAHGPSLRVPVETVGVVTQPDRPAGRGRTLRSNAVKALAVQHGLVVLQPDRVRRPEAIRSVLEVSPDVVIVASFGQILPTDLLETPRYKSLNLHPSLLPRLRGASPIQTAILEGDSRTGTTLILMTAEMDAGPILAQKEVAVRESETSGELTDRLAVLSGELLLDTLPDWITGGISPRPQDDSLATYTTRIGKEDGLLDWFLPAETLARRIRAFNPWPVAHTYWQGRLLRLLRAHSRAGEAEPGVVSGVENGSLIVGSGSGLLLIDEMQLAGGKPARAGDLVRGYPALLSARFTSEAEVWSSA